MGDRARVVLGGQAEGLEVDRRHLPGPAVGIVVERRDPQPDRYSVDDLLFQVNMGCLSRNTRWLGGILAAHAPIEFEPAPESLREGLIGLTLRDWLSEADHRWEPQGTLLELCERLGNLNPYAVIASDPHGGTQVPGFFGASVGQGEGTSAGNCLGAMRVRDF